MHSILIEVDSTFEIINTYINTTHFEGFVLCPGFLDSISVACVLRVNWVSLVPGDLVDYRLVCDRCLALVSNFVQSTHKGKVYPSPPQMNQLLPSQIHI